MPTPDYEKLGVFYLGKDYDLAARSRTRDLVLYDSKDLVTHAVCVGMTGSGKTGLCLGILEEAAIDGIPAIIIDPKGDLSNLLLTFPQLRPADFRPWINEDDARKKGQTPDDFAAVQASMWSKGLADWDQDGARIQRLRDAADFAVYTPGSSAGLELSILKSLRAPEASVMEDEEQFRDYLDAVTGSIMAILGSQSDMIRHWASVLIATILSNAWRQGKDVDLLHLIQEVNSPSFPLLGAMPIDSAAPPRDRLNLAQAINVVLASPSSGSWTNGAPIDARQLLYTPDGKPRVSIISISHLSDSERMMVVSLLLQEVLSWARRQSGTTSLRALLYMDEIAGYFPPVANPPSKKPLLTLMKQARAFGVGVILATQNPVDLDYKGLANAGTWLIGRLQTDRDKQRVLDGLEGAAANAGARFDRASMDRTLSALGPRIFLMNNVHEDEPRIIESRWCLSYLRGPLTRQQIKLLMDPLKVGAAASPAPAASAPSPAPSGGGQPRAQRETGGGVAVTSSTTSSSRPILPAEIPQYFLPARAIPAGSTLLYRPMLFGAARVYYTDTKTGVDETDPQSLLAPINPAPAGVDWDEAEQADLAETDLESDPAPGATFGPLPADAAKAKSYAAWQKDFADALYKVGKLELFKYAPLKTTSKQGESEKDFRLRLSQLIREKRDEQKERLRQKYAPKLAALQDRLRRAQQQVEAQKSQSTSAKIGAAVSFGAAILGAFMGKKVMSATNISKAGTAMRSVGRVTQESADVGRAEENVAAIQQQYADLEAQFKEESDTIDSDGDPMTDDLEKVVLKPKKTNINVRLVALCWAPHAVDAGNQATPAW